MREPTEAFIKLNENAPYGRGAGQMNKLFKNQSHQLLSVSLGTQSRGADEEEEEWQLHV